MRTSRTGIIISVLPSLLMLGLFYSLAAHMHQSLGGWPSSIGEAGFPPTLLTHANITVLCFESLFLACFVLVPVASIVCLLVQRWRPVVPYLALFAALFLVCWGCMELAPDQFLYWWRD